MVEVDATYLWQTQHSVDAKFFYASTSVASRMLYCALISGQRKASKHIMPTWASQYPYRLFSFSRNTFQPQILA